MQEPATSWSGQVTIHQVYSRYLASSTPSTRGPFIPSFSPLYGYLGLLLPRLISG